LLRAFYGNGGIPNPLSTILRQQDSLKLTSAQADSLAMLNRTYTVRNDAIWAPLIKEFANLPDSYDHSTEYEKYMSARRSTIDLLMQIGPAIKGLLTAEQRRKLPTFVASYLEPRYLASIRPGTATFVGNGGFGGGAVSVGDFIAAGGGGGTVERVIIRQ
jgi:hypothetical protein